MAGNQLLLLLPGQEVSKPLLRELGNGSVKNLALPHFAWSRPTSVSYKVTDPKMESALACLAVYDTLAEAN